MERIKYFLAVIFITVAASVSAQINQRTDIIKFDFNTYQGTPIQKGWLFNESSYKKLYVSYNSIDSLMDAFQRYTQMMKKMDSLNQIVNNDYQDRIKIKDLEIDGLKKAVLDSKTLLDQSDKNVKAFEKQFWYIGRQRIHKSTAIKCAITFGVLGWLVGKSGI